MPWIFNNSFYTQYNFSKSIIKSTFITVLFLFLTLNYKFIENITRIIFPKIQYWHLLPIIFVILFHVSYIIIYKRLKEKTVEMINLVVLITFSVLLIINGIIALPDIYNKIFYSTNTIESKPIGIVNNDNDSLPNIYYFIFDEFASFEAIEKYYGYENEELYKFLESNDFSISSTSKNQSSSTLAVLANIVALDYIYGSDTPNDKWNDLIKDGILFDLIKSAGYKIVPIGASEETFGLNESVSNATASTIEGYDFKTLVLMNTAWSFLIDRTKVDEIRAQQVLDMVDYFNKLTVEPLNNIFTMTYIVSPHVPYVFDENGNETSYINRNNNMIKEPYLGQYKYISKLIIKIVQKILGQDPNSIIILQSDHGARSLYNSDTKENIIQPQDRLKIFNAVYYQGKILDIEGLSGLNTLRKVLSITLNLELPVVTMP